MRVSKSGFMPYWIDGWMMALWCWQSQGDAFFSHPKHLLGNTSVLGFQFAVTFPSFNNSRGRLHLKTHPHHGQTVSLKWLLWFINKEIYFINVLEDTIFHGNQKSS